MLSLSNVGNGTTAASYYEAADDYYTSDHGPSAWWCAGAASLVLQGAVDASVFAALLDGRLPSGETLHHAAAGRRGGTDDTFSAPKSVSLQPLVAGDRRIVQTHNLAVDRALAYAETLAATTGRILINRHQRRLRALLGEHGIDHLEDDLLIVGCQAISLIAPDFRDMQVNGFGQRLLGQAKWIGRAWNLILCRSRLGSSPPRTTALWSR